MSKSRVADPWGGKTHAMQRYDGITLPDPDTLFCKGSIKKKKTRDKWYDLSESPLLGEAVLYDFWLEGPRTGVVGGW